MRLHIVHATTYIYDRPVSFGRHRLVLRPREGHDLRIERMDLRIEPDHRLMWVRDVFGNSVALVDLLAGGDVLTITNELTVERIAPFPAREFHEPWRVAWPPRYDPMEARITATYQVPAYPDDAPAVKEWLARELVTDPLDAEGSLQALCDLVHRSVGYQRRLAKGVQTPAQTLELRTGSCRDMATLMMDAARLLGVSARFSSGYLHSRASVAGHGSTHAWTEMYLPMLGWRGFDPTTGRAVGLGHVVTGVSDHPRGVMPISGAYSGAAGACKALQVTVTSRELLGGAGEPDAGAGDAARIPVAAVGRGASG